MKEEYFRSKKDKGGKDMKFNLYGMSLEYSVGMENFNVIRKNVWGMVDDMEEEFSETYFKRFSGMDDVIKGIEVLATEYIKGVVEWGMLFLNQNGVHCYDATRFFEEYGNICCEELLKAFEKIEDEYMEIVSTQEEMEEYRRARKANRSRMVGGGFGLGGAIKGMATAGTVNLATGMAHSAVNIIGNTASGIGASINKAILYKSEDTIKAYKTGIGKAMKLFGYAIAKTLRDNSKLPVEFPSSQEMADSEAIIKNVNAGYVADGDVASCCIKALKLDPYNSGAYLTVFERFGDSNCELEEFADCFGMQVVTYLKEKLYIKKLSEINYADRNKFDKDIESFNKDCDFYGIDRENTTDCFELVKDLHRQRAKIIDGELYSTEVEAVEYDKIIKCFIETIQKVDGNDVEGITRLINEIDASTIKSKDKYISYLKDALKREDERYRLVKGKLYNTREDAEVARRDGALLEKWFNGVVFESLEDIQTLKADIEREIHSDFQKMALERVALLEKIWISQEESIGKSIVFEKRVDFAELFYFEKLKFMKAQFLNIRNLKYQEWYAVLINSYLTVYGVLHKDPADADKAFFKEINHALAYVKYINEKNSTKKTFLSSLKNNITGIVYKNYESSFYMVTESGSKSIPPDSNEDFEQIKLNRKARNDAFENYKKQFAEKFSRMEQSLAIPAEKLEAWKLYVDTEPVDRNEILKIMREVCEEIEIKK